MRRLIYSNCLILIGMLCSFSLLFSCNGGNVTQPSLAQVSLVGRWEMMGNNRSENVLTLCIYEDSSFTISAPNGVPQSGDWLTSHDTLKCYGHRNEYSGRTQDCFELVFKIVRLDEKTLFLGDFETRQVMEFKKIHE